MHKICLKRAVVALCFLLCVFAAYAQKYTVTGGKGTPLLAVDNNTGMASSKLQVYLVYGMDNVEIRYTPVSGSYKWYRFKDKALNREEIPSREEGGATVVSGLEEGYGYYVQEGDAVGNVEGYVWIIDYSKYAFDITSLYVDASRSGCGNMYLGGEAEMEDMEYCNPSTGYAVRLNREFEVTYETMKKNSDESSYVEATVTETINDPFNDPLPAPLCDTDVTLKGDLFARHFGVEKTMTTDVYQAVAVDAAIKVDTLLYTESSNMVVNGDSLSAPVEFNFKAVANTPVAALFRWSIYRKDDTEEASEATKLIESNEEEVNYLFDRNGTYTVYLTVSDRTSTCTWETDSPVTITISDSYIDVPNAFSPGTTPGVNDEFRVVYRSLTNFKCWIFNRWGVQMYYWTDPSQGWDGKKNGKYVAPGVYFYVIEATGSNGKTIKKKGSINILKSKEIQDEVVE